MSPRTLTPAPTDRSMWRRLLRLAHPDGAGSHDLFIWTRSIYEHVAGDYIEDARRSYQRREPPRHHERAKTSENRLDFTHAYSHAESFDALTAQALERAQKLSEPFRSLILLLHDCRESEEINLSRQQQQGATYKTLAAIGHTVRMSQPQRSEWYRIAEQMPLSQRHAGHIFSRLRQQAA
jgi:hypothetical protein